MKKYNIVTLVIFSFIFIPICAYATSGACSNHGGVNCTAGIGNQGANAVCNDGFESSTSYYDTDECIGKLSPCAQPVKTYCTTTSDIRAHCGAPSQYTSDMYGICVSDCQNQINKYQTDLATYNSCVSNQPNSSSNITTTPDSKMQEYCVELFGNNVTYNPTKEDCDCNPGYAVGLNRKCSLITCPPNASNVNGHCTCNDGYFISGSSCITYNQSCQNQYGTNSYGDKDKCYCNTGYQWNTSNTACISIVCPGNSSLSGSQCFCNSGYVWNTLKTECILIPPVAATPPTPTNQNTTPTTATTTKKSKFMEGATIGQPAIPKTNGINDSKLTTIPSVTPVKVITPATAPKKSIMGKVWDFIKGLFGK